MRVTDRIAQGLLRPINPYSTLILGFFTALWGLWVLLPQWSVFEHAQLFSRMAQFCPEWAWGSWAMTAGILIIVGVARGFYKSLSWALGFTVWHWATVASMLWWGDWQNTGGLTYTAIAVFTTYAYLNIKVNQVKFGEDIPHFLP